MCFGLAKTSRWGQSLCSRARDFSYRAHRAAFRRRTLCRDPPPVYVSIYELHDKWIELEMWQMIGDNSHQVQMGRKYRSCRDPAVSASQVGYKAKYRTFKFSCYVCVQVSIVSYVCLPT
jgi:hypothetical protein